MNARDSSRALSITPEMKKQKKFDFFDKCTARCKAADRFAAPPTRTQKRRSNSTAAVRGRIRIHCAQAPALTLKSSPMRACVTDYTPRVDLRAVIRGVMIMAIITTACAGTRARTVPSVSIRASLQRHFIWERWLRGQLSNWRRSHTSAGTGQS